MFRSSGAIVLPGPLQRRADELARSFLQPEQGIDFSAPPGEPALVAADSVSWRIFKNPVTVFIGGVAAVLMEFAEPRVRDGVWQHSNFRADPLTRLRRTGLAAMVTVYGPQGAAQAMIAGVARRHERVSGRTLEGEPYRASDPDLLDWVQATAGFGFTQAYHAYARPLTAQERGLLLIEALPAARLYGATGAPASGAELDALFEARRPRLRPGRTRRPIDPDTSMRISRREGTACCRTWATKALTWSIAAFAARRPCGVVGATVRDGASKPAARVSWSASGAVRAAATRSAPADTTGSSPEPLTRRTG